MAQTAVETLANDLAACDRPDMLFHLASRAASLARSSAGVGALLAAHTIVLSLAHRSDDALSEQDWAAMRALLAAVAGFLRSGEVSDLDLAAKEWLDHIGVAALN